MDKKTTILTTSSLLILSVIAIIGYFLLAQNQQKLHHGPHYNSSEFPPHGNSWIAGCVNVQFHENVEREQVRSLLRQIKNLKTAEPFFYDGDVFLVPEVHAIVRDFDQAATIQGDPCIVNIYFPDCDSVDSDCCRADADGSCNIVIDFIDSMTLDQAYKLLANTYHLEPWGGLRDTTLQLEVAPGSENSVVKTLRLSPITQDASQCTLPNPEPLINSTFSTHPGALD